MLGAFLVPLLDFSFDDTWIPAVAARSEVLPGHFVEQSFIPFVNRSGGRFVQMTLEHAERVGER
jgi:hypothetical protein